MPTQWQYAGTAAPSLTARCLRYTQAYVACGQPSYREAPPGGCSLLNTLRCGKRPLLDFRFQLDSLDFLGVSSSYTDHPSLPSSSNWQRNGLQGNSNNYGSSPVPSSTATSSQASNSKTSPPKGNLITASKSSPTATKSSPASSASTSKASTLAAETEFMGGKNNDENEDPNSNMVSFVYFLLWFLELPNPPTFSLSGHTLKTVPPLSCRFICASTKEVHLQQVWHHQSVVQGGHSVRR